MKDETESSIPQKNQKKRKEIELTMDEYYTLDKSWEQRKDHIFAALKYRYPEYFIDGQPNYSKIGEELKNDPLKAKAAREIFSSYFRFPYKSTYTTANTEYPFIMEIIEGFGDQIIAHGVEEAKGGMYNLLMMGVSNQVHVPEVHWGALIPSLPNISPVSHGPYYVIYDTPFCESKKSPHYPLFTEISCILVPFELNKTLLIEAMEKMVALEVTSESIKQLFISKLRTYEEFYEELLKPKKEPKNKLSESDVAPLSWMSTANRAATKEKIVSSSSTELPESDDEDDSLDWLLMP